MASSRQLAAVSGLGVLLFLAGCSDAVPPGALVLTQTPVQSVGRSMPITQADVWYPAGSRVVLAWPGSRVKVLSSGLVSAGSPAISLDGKSVLFAGKASELADWQIYQTPITGGEPTVLTSLSGGAMSPALLPDGRFVFSSPVPKLASSGPGVRSPALYAESLSGGAPQPLTFGLAGASDPTVLPDGRILFVSSGAESAAVTNSALFTVNNDGTEIAPFACQHDARARLRRPRALPDGRVVFLTTDLDSVKPSGRAEQVLAARPFSSRKPVAPGWSDSCRSIDAADNGDLLVTLRPAQRGEAGTFAVWRLGPEAKELGAPLFDDPQWNDVEAIGAAAPSRPMGRLSNVDTNEATGLMLCLDAEDTTLRAAGTPPAKAIRVLRRTGAGREQALGEVPLQADGSFFVEVPADTALGFEALDAGGQVLRRLPPSVWVRPGENRACIGCHEPHSRTPDNHRPLAVRQPAVRLGATDKALAQTPPRP
jgi:hypothetical protein